MLQWLLHAPLLGFLGLLFGVVALVYAWGPRDLDVDVEAIIDAHDAPTRREAIARLWPEGEGASIDGSALVEAVFRNALQRWPALRKALCTTASVTCSGNAVLSTTIAFSPPVSAIRGTMGPSLAASVRLMTRATAVLPVKHTPAV